MRDCCRASLLCLKRMRLRSGSQTCFNRFVKNVSTSTSIQGEEKILFLIFHLALIVFPPSLLLFKMFQKCARVNGLLWGRGGAVFCVVHHLPESKTSYTILGHSKGHDNNKECYRNTMLLFVRNFSDCLADVHQGMFSVVLFLVRLFCNICWQKNPSRFRPTSSMIPPDITTLNLVARQYLFTSER